MMVASVRGVYISNKNPIVNNIEDFPPTKRSEQLWEVYDDFLSFLFDQEPTEAKGEFRTRYSDLISSGGLKRKLTSRIKQWEKEHSDHI